MTNYLYPYNYSNNTGLSGIGDFISYVTIENPYLPIGFLSLIFLFSFGVGMSLGSRKALTVSGFVTFIFSIFFLRMGILNPVITITLLIITIIGALFSKEEASI